MLDINTFILWNTKTLCLYSRELRCSKADDNKEVCCWSRTFTSIVLHSSEIRSLGFWFIWIHHKLVGYWYNWSWSINQIFVSTMYRIQILANRICVSKCPLSINLVMMTIIYGCGPRIAGCNYRNIVIEHVEWLEIA